MDAARVAGGRGRPVAAGEAARARSQASLGASFAVRAAFIWPALLAILFVSIYPLLASLYISLSRLKLVRGGFEFRFVGLDNFRELLVGGEQGNFLGVQRPLGPVGWAVMATGVALLGWGLVRAWRGGASVAGMVFRVLGALLAAGTLWLAARTLLAAGGRPGTAMVTLVYVLVGITAQFLLGLGLAYLLTQGLPGQRFFRVVFLLPMMITPVGVAYMFRMLTDTGKGPLQPLWAAVGLSDFSWVNSPWGARVAVMVGDIWQWTPFMFIVLLAAIENQPRDQVEAARLDGAGGWQIFRDITWPAIAPVAATVVLIRLIEAFKIIDLPNVLTGGGPGLATESMTLHAFIAWRTQDLGGSAAVGYMLLFISTVVCVSFFNFVVRHSRRFEA
ncbi:MAG TPA: sugar ABC transporter permease [Actinomycetota bacterium]|nr:sugar ABC transporter permease [Actinomycetota bacterium]